MSVCNTPVSSAVKSLLNLNIPKVHPRAMIPCLGMKTILTLETTMEATAVAAIDNTNKAIVVAVVVTQVIL